MSSQSDETLAQPTKPSATSERWIGGGPVRASIIVPAFNAASTLPSCLASLLAQKPTLCRFELIVVDDGSTDATADVVQRLSEIHLAQAQHRGPASARNLGVQSAHGDIVLFTDADCAPVQGWVDAMVAPFMDSARDIAGTKGVYRTLQREPLARFVQLEYEEKYALMSRARSIDFVDTYSAAYERSIFVANGGFDESFPSASVEDQEFSFRLAEKGYQMILAPEAQVYHRHVTSLGDYVRRKFRIGYWKVHLQLRHPSKIWNDSHTPTTLRLEVALVTAAALTLVLVPFASMARVLLIAFVVAFELTSIPLLIFVVRRDPGLALLAPLFILARAAALAAGLAAGVFGEIARSSRIQRSIDSVGVTVGSIVFRR